MNYKEFNISLPINTNNVAVVDGLIQYDTANIVNVRLMDGIEPFDFTGYTDVYIEILKPDGTHIQACVADDPEITGDNNPYSIHVVDPKEGRISFNLQGQATILTGTHFGQVMITSGGKILTSARINYYVGDTLQSDDDLDEVTSSGDYASLRAMIARNSAIATAERDRIDAETLRRLAELAREERIEELEDYITNYLNNAVAYVEQTEDYMEEAEKFAQLAQNPSAEIIEQLIAQLDLASETYVDDSIDTATKDFDAGNYTDGADAKKLLKARRGNEADIPALEVGEFGFSTDAGIAYIGGNSGNIALNGVYVAQETAPDRHDILWVDTASGSAVKYWNGNAWTPTATATFA